MSGGDTGVPVEEVSKAMRCFIAAILAVVTSAVEGPARDGGDAIKELKIRASAQSRVTV